MISVPPEGGSRSQLRVRTAPRPGSVSETNHKCQIKFELLHVILVFLPPYSPELNPIERLWLHLRDNCLYHCVFQTTEGIIDTCCEAWNWLLAETGRIRSLCSYLWLEQVSS